MNHLKLDRRAAACVLTLGLVGTYIFLPVGFGAIFLEQILMGNINKIGAAYGLHVERSMMPMGMAIPVLGMVLVLLVAVFISYRKPVNMLIDQFHLLQALIWINHYEQQHKLNMTSRRMLKS